MHWWETLRIVRSKIRRWRDGDSLGLWAELLDDAGRFTRRRRPGRSAPESTRASNVLRAKQAIEDGQYQKAMQALTSGGLARYSPEVYAEMLAKHPQDDLSPVPSFPVPTPLMISECKIVRALRSFPNGTAPGPSSLRANLIKEAVFCPSPDRANSMLCVLCDLINLLCGGNVPPDVVPHLCGASLLPCTKKNGGLRPIAVGEVLRRLISKCISSAVQNEASRILSPLQLGVGVPGGCEAIVHVVSASTKQINGACSWTSPMLSTASAVSICLRR